MWIYWTLSLLIVTSIGLANRRVIVGQIDQDLQKEVWAGLIIMLVAFATIGWCLPQI